MAVEPERFTARAVAVFGSFRKHFKEIQTVCDLFRGAGLEVTTPKGTKLIDPRAEFVRLDEDDISLNDIEVEERALARALQADFVYFVLPDGYIGRTACYELGRLIEAKHPVYVSHVPLDLPVRISPDHVLSASELLSRVEVVQSDS